jgi:hypothetical protein
MGGIYQLLDLALIAVAILAGLLLAAYMVGRFFQDKKIRKRIMFGAIGVFLLGVVTYFGFIAFILSGDLNRN